MSNTFNRIRHNRELRGVQGFTLIEMLIVIVVLGVLAAIVVFALGNVTGDSAVSACNSDAKTVSIAISAEQTQTPDSAPALAVGSDPGDLVPAYMKSLPGQSGLYSISLSLDNLAVEVTLGANAPGAAYSDASGPQLWEADSTANTQPFQYDPSDGTIGGQGICAGA